MRRLASTRFLPLRCSECGAPLSTDTHEFVCAFCGQDHRPVQTFRKGESFTGTLTWRENEDGTVDKIDEKILFDWPSDDHTYGFNG